LAKGGHTIEILESAPAITYIGAGLHPISVSGSRALSARGPTLISLMYFRYSGLIQLVADPP
jgi:hypothetical protein